MVVSTTSRRALRTLADSEHQPRLGGRRAFEINPTVIVEFAADNQIASVEQLRERIAQPITSGGMPAQRLDS
jgi:hypothetical protein